MIEMAMGKSAALALVILLALPAAATAGPECRCRYQGKEFEQGALACIRIGATTRLARCDMLLNNSSWTFIKDGCPSAALTPLPEGWQSRRPS